MCRANLIIGPLFSSSHAKLSERLRRSNPFCPGCLPQLVTVRVLKCLLKAASAAEGGRRGEDALTAAGSPSSCHTSPGTKIIRINALEMETRQISGSCVAGLQNSIFLSCCFEQEKSILGANEYFCPMPMLSRL